MLQKRDAFTLIEMIVVVLIIGILASIAIPQYMKTVEASRARSAMGITHLIGIANRMYEVDRLDYVNGRQTGTCNDGGACNPITNRCNLVRCKYLAEQDWLGAVYDFYACDPDTGGGGGYCTEPNSVASCRRKGAPPPGKAAGWGYSFQVDGSCTEHDGTGSWLAPRCPSI